MANPILGSDNSNFGANVPSGYPGTFRGELDGLPLGVTATGEVGLKVIVIGNASIKLSDLPTNDPHQAGVVWNNDGSPVVSQG